MEYFKQVEDIIDKASNEEYGYAKRWLKEITNRKYLCVFGGGTFGHMWLDLFEKYNINVDFICDNDINKWGKKFGRQISCISPKKLESFKDDVNIVVATRHSATIEKQLSNQGFVNIFIAPLEIFYFKNNFQYVGNKKECLVLKKNISKLLTICADEDSKKVCINLIKRWMEDIREPMPYVDDQYFVEDIIKLGKNEIFVDAGAFDGDSIQAFLNKVNYQFIAIYGFEMDPKIYKKLYLNINNMEKYKEKILLYNIGLWDEKCEVSYSSNDTSSYVNPCGCEKISMDKLDSLIDKVSFLKMDIEGAELQALQGAKEIISRDKPKLAVCVYHLADHLWEVPFYIKKLVPEYKIYFRHHTSSSTETVCYALI